MGRRCKRYLAEKTSDSRDELHQSKNDNMLYTQHIIIVYHLMTRKNRYAVRQ